MTELENGQVLEMNPYVIQIDKFVTSLDKLSKFFLRLEGARMLPEKEEIEDMYEKIEKKVCGNCEHKSICLEEKRNQTYQMLEEIFDTIENYGAELNIPIKRKVQRNCIQAPRFLRIATEVYTGVKQNLLWNNRMAQSRESCVVQLDSFAQMIQHATRELDASIFEDEPLAKRIKMRLDKVGVKLLNSVFFVTEEGRYEIHVTVRAEKGHCVATKELAQLISECVGRKMILEWDERPIIGPEFCTITCMEGPRFHTLQGVAKIGKGCYKISGDSFSMLDLPGGKQGVILSDGMGAGENASRESTSVVEMLEELLSAGFPKETAIQMLNTALAMGREEVRFSTFDMSEFDLYTGKCEFVKAGASTTFIKRQDRVECIKSTSLPIGVLPRLEIDSTKAQMSDGDVVIMVTDGVMDALPVGEQEVLMKTIIMGTQMTNPKEIAHHILEQVLEWSGEVPLDDMTIMAVGIWSLEK